MAFEQDIRQKHIEKHEHLQKIKENEQFQQELDAIIEQLDQESQQPSSAEKEPSCHESVTEREPIQLNLHETSTQCSNDLSIFHNEENPEEQQIQNQDIKKVENATQEEQEPPSQQSPSTGLYSESFPQEIMRDQKTELNLLQKIEENDKFHQDTDLIITHHDHASQEPPSAEKVSISHESVIEKNQLHQQLKLKASTQIFHDHHSSQQEGHIQGQQTQAQIFAKGGKSIQEVQKPLSQQSSREGIYLKSSQQGTTRSQKEANLDRAFEHVRPDHLEKNQRILVQDPLMKDQNSIRQESLEYLQPSLMMTLMYIGKELGISYKRYNKTWWENMGGLSTDNELWKVFKTGNVDSLVDKVLRISRRLGWKSHGGERQLKRICDEIEFKINGKSVKESIKLADNSYSIEFLTQDSVSLRNEYLIGFVVRSPIVNTNKFNRNLITLLPKITMGYNSDGKITLKFFDRVNDRLPSGYIVYKGYQNEVRLVCKNQSSKSSKKLIEDALLWLRKQTVSNLEGFILEKRSRQTIGTVTSLDEKNFKLFELQKSCYKNAILRLDFFPTWRYARGGQYRFGHKAMGILTRSNLRIPLKNLIEYYISTQKQEDVPEIRSEIGKVVNINIDDYNENLKLRVGTNYLNIVKTKSFPKKRFMQCFNRLESRKAIISTLKEFTVYQTLKDHYIQNNFQNFAINVDKIVEEAMPRIRRVFRVFTQIGGLQESGILQTLEKQGLISKCYTSRNNLIITWVDVSNDVSDSYRYWISKIYSRYTPVTQRQRETLLQHAIAEGYAFEEIDGKNIFSRTIPEGYAPIPVKNWEIYIIKGDDEVSVIPQLLELTYANSKKDTLVSNATFKSRVKSFIEDHPNYVEVIKDNLILNKTGLEASIKNNMLKEGPPGLDGTIGDGFAKFDELFNKITKKSILGKEFNGLRILKSNQEAAVRNELFIASDFVLIDSQGKVVGNGIAKGVSHENTFTRQAIEQLTEKGKRFILFPEWDGDTARVYVITLGGAGNNNFDIVKPQNHNDLYWESLFHHAIQTKIRVRYQYVTRIEPSLANFDIDNELIDLVTKKIIENKRNEYPEEIQQRWKKFIEDLKTDLSEKALQAGIPLSKFNEWVSTRYKSYLTWSPDQNLA